MCNIHTEWRKFCSAYVGTNCVLWVCICSWLARNRHQIPLSKTQREHMFRSTLTIKREFYVISVQQKQLKTICLVQEMKNWHHQNYIKCCHWNFDKTSRYSSTVHVYFIYMLLYFKHEKCQPRGNCLRKLQPGIELSTCLLTVFRFLLFFSNNFWWKCCSFLLSFRKKTWSRHIWHINACLSFQGRLKQYLETNCPVLPAPCLPY